MAAPSVPSVPSAPSEPSWFSFELVGHTSYVTNLVGHPFLPMLASGSYDGTVRVWDLETRRCVRTLEGHTNMVIAVAFDPTGRRLASTSFDNTVKLWDLDSTKETCLLHTLRDRAMRTVRVVAWHPSSTLVASGSDDGRVRVWDAASGSLLHTLEGHSNWFQAVVSHPTDDMFASASDDKTVRVWRWSTGESVHTLEGHTEPVTSLAASAFFVVSGSWDKTVRVWSWTSGLCVRLIDDFKSPLQRNSLAWRDSTLAASERDGTIHVWDTSDEEDPTKWSCVQSLPSLTKSWCATVMMTSGGQIAIMDIGDGATIAVHLVDLADDD